MTSTMPFAMDKEMTERTSSLTREIVKALASGRLKVEAQNSESPQTTDSTFSSRSSSRQSPTQILLDLEKLEKELEEGHRESMSNLKKTRLTRDQTLELAHNMAMAKQEHSNCGQKAPVQILNNVEARPKKTWNKYKPWTWL